MEEIIGLKFAMLQKELTERQRRLWAASEAMCLGHGGVSLASRATGLSRTTLHRGLRELQSGDTLAENRVRRKGGERKKIKDLQPTLVATLDSMVEPTAKGDPTSPLRWTCKSTRCLTTALQASGFSISHIQVYKRLSEMGYQLAANRKSMEGGTNPAATRNLNSSTSRWRSF